MRYLQMLMKGFCCDWRNLVSTGMWDCNKVFMVDIWYYGYIYRWLSSAVEILGYKLLLSSCLCVDGVLNTTKEFCFLVLKLVDSN